MYFLQNWHVHILCGKNTLHCQRRKCSGVGNVDVSVMNLLDESFSVHYSSTTNLKYICNGWTLLKYYWTFDVSSEFHKSHKWCVSLQEQSWLRQTACRCCLHWRSILSPPNQPRCYSAAGLTFLISPTVGSKYRYCGSQRIEASEPMRALTR